MHRWHTRFVAALSLLVAVAASSLPSSAETARCESRRGKVVGGEEARIANWPGQAALRFHAPDIGVAQYFCGGTAISKEWVLTAAHCFDLHKSALKQLLRSAKGAEALGGMQVVIGLDDLTTAGDESIYPVDRIVIHPAFKDHQRGDDIALLHLARRWSGPVAALSLAADSDPPADAQSQVRVAGFGTTVEGSKLDRYLHADGKQEVYAGSARLLEAAVETVPTPRCAERYSGATIADGQICAGLEDGGKDSCQGDSGGPLVIADKNGCPAQIGIVSWGDGCAQKQAYGVYTRVSAYADWIEQHTGKLASAASTMPTSQAGDQLTPTQLDETLRQLEGLLGPTKGRVRIGIRGGNTVRLGAEVVFEASSDLDGRLVILDINANRAVTLLYPTKGVAESDLGRIGKGDAVTVPAADDPDLTAFQAVEPTGKGHLVALVVPEDFDIGRHAAPKSQRAKGFAAVNNPPSYIMRLLRQIEKAIQSAADAGRSADKELSRWGYAVTEYEIVE